jgi:TRAP-type C4-dicarboxylate transport system permease small subunit
MTAFATKTFATKIRRGAELLSAAMFAVMFGAFILQVVSRYVFDAPVSWTVEICSIAYIWIVFCSSVTILTLDRHITFDMLYGVLTPHWKRCFAIFTTASLFIIFLICLPGTLDYLVFVGKNRTLILRIRLDLIYACFGIFMVGAIVGAGIRLYRLLSPKWQSRL